MKLLAEQTHEAILNDILQENGCYFLCSYGYRVKRLACAYISIQQLQARLNYVDSYQSDKLADVHDLWLEHKNVLGDELRVLLKRKDLNSFVLAMNQTLQAWRKYYREDRYVN
tara:strand:- start:224 stop:562 length:339 start_codon:yes stop_codon:yes gene_type:complete